MLALNKAAWWINILTTDCWWHRLRTLPCVPVINCWHCHASRPSDALSSRRGWLSLPPHLARVAFIYMRPSPIWPLCRRALTARSSDRFAGRAFFLHAAMLSLFDKYILQFGQIYFAIWTNAFSNFYKYILIIQTNTYCNLLVFMQSNLMATENHLSIFVKYMI